MTINNDRRTQNKIAVLGTIFLLTTLMISQPLASALDNENVFELGPAQGADILGDGNAANGPDWADLFDANGNPTGPFTVVADSFSADELAVSGLTDETIFSGSNKNNDLISVWEWDTGNTPVKDDISNVYTAAVINPADDHLIIFAGVERLSPNGDSHVDIEFFQDDIGLSEDPECTQATCTFTGDRAVGDIIVSMDFLQGGAIGEVSIRQWDGNEYVLIETLDGEGCDDTDDACAFNNGGLINGGPWPNYDSKGNEIENLEQNAFTEFGMDVTALFEDTPCISNYMSKTRSSQSFTAELKDFSPPENFNVCSAFIEIGPDAVNEVGDPHTFTVTAGKKIADLKEPVDDGTIFTVDLTDSNGAVSTVSNDACATGTTGGTCDVTFTSDSAGTVTGHASGTISFGGLSFDVETDGTGNNSGDAVKRFVDARIGIDPDAVNEVGDPHTFTVTVETDDGTGSGFSSVVDNTLVTVDLTDSNGAVSTVSNDACATGTTGGTCDVTFTSDSAGTVTGHASSTITIDGVSMFRETDGVGSNSDDAIKRFVDAFISIAPDDVNSIEEDHTFTVTVSQDDGTGSGVASASDGTLVTVDLTDSAGAANNVSEDTCLLGTVGGECSITFTSATTGTVTGHASSTITIDGVDVTRSTDGTGSNSDDAVKEFVAGSISWLKEDNAGNLLGGATFELCRTANYDSDTDTFVPIDPEVCLTVEDNAANDQDLNAGQIQVIDLVLGQYSITETIAPEGFAIDDTVLNAEITLASPDAEVSTAFVNQRPIVKVTEFGYTNTPTGTPTQGIVSGSTTYTVSLQNFGGADAIASASLTISVPGLGAGTVTFVDSTGSATTEPAAGDDCSVSCTVEWTGISLSANEGDSEPVLTVTIKYADVADATAIQSDLTSVYTTTTDSLERSSSGSAATIVFTTQND